MKLSAFTYVRNGFEFNYPFIESIKSLLPLVDEYIVVVGDSSDGSREAVAQLGPKIKIIDTVWDMSLRKGGKLFSTQSNAGLDNISGDWAIHLQADEVLHELDLAKLSESIQRNNSDAKVEGLLFPFLNFYGDYDHIHTGRTAHRYEIRAFKRSPQIRSYRDSQGFRKYPTLDAYEKGIKSEKLNVAKIDVPVFHYSYVRPPEQMRKKANYFMRFWFDDNIVHNLAAAGGNLYDYNAVDKLENFLGTHPAIMNSRISSKDWTFLYNPKKQRVSMRHKLLNYFEKLTGYRLGEYKNYRLVKGRR